MYTIKQASEMTGISSYALRFYDKEGLFPGLRRDGRNRRIFSAEDLQGIERIQHFRKMGLPVAEIRRHIQALAKGAATLEDRYALILEQRKKVKENLLAVMQQLQAIEREAESYRNAIEAKREQAEDGPSGLHLQVA